ncbi:DUF11 domain-containing protein [Chengkuizengella marina]|uniref:DUF11 domain-containing protein n=1 Tax=Chengkuizengella marina TaxID=2507566 RepID=A0A6N9Q106_9BACL|nr:DUF11 domain-containing protein [Chengkuizengella marina]NBI29017.1 DUF11 domain-containing protein [Chengkuizengella marina]
MFINRFTTNTCGAMTFTGNTLGLSQETNMNAAGTAGSIGAFITLDTSQPMVDAFPIDPVPPGATTTLSIDINSSAANLVIPAGSTVLYAELIWGGNYLSRDEDITSLINNDVLFTVPGGSVFSITPDPLTANEPTFDPLLAVDPFFLNASVNLRGFYMRSADVTNMVQNFGAGQYAVGQVPGLLDPLIASTNNTNHAGWTLAVIYENFTSFPFRNMTLFVGAQGIVNASTNPIIDVAVSGFTTPTAGMVSARALISAGEGDANISGDQCLFGPNVGTLVNLFGANNPAMNFFGSQIEDDTGAVDTSGTYGSSNQVPGTPGMNISAGRQGWDIANVDASSALVNNQNSGVFRFTSTQDAYMPNALGLQIDQLDSVLNVEKSVDIFLAKKGDILTYTIEITNPGPSIATNIILTDVEPIGSDFIENSVTINGVLQPGADPNAGIQLGDLVAGETTTVQFRVRVTAGKCFVTNVAIVRFSCNQISESNQALTTICHHCPGCASCQKKGH